MPPKKKPPISEHVFAQYLDCTYKAFLSLHGRKGQQTLLEKHCVEFDTNYQTHSIMQLLSEHTPQEVNRQRNLNKSFDLAYGHLLLVDHVTVGDLEVGPILLCRNAVHSTRLEPVYFYRYPSPSPRVKLMLGFRACVVGIATGSTPSHGYIIYGDNYKAMSLSLSPYLKKAESIISQIREIASAEDQPLYLNPHCDICEFRDVCRTKAGEEDNMSLIHGVSRGYIENMNRRGIFTLHQLSYTFRPRKTPKRAKNPANPRHYALQAQAIREQRVFIHGAPEVPTSTTSLYLDIEGIPER